MALQDDRRNRFFLDGKQLLVNPHFGYLLGHSMPLLATINLYYGTRVEDFQQALLFLVTL